MKQLLSTKIMVALALTIAVVAAVVIEAQEQPIPPPTTSAATTTASTDPNPAPATPAPPENDASAAPAPPPSDSAAAPNIPPGSGLSDVVKMLQAGIDPGTIQIFIQNSEGAFNLDADKILYLKDIGAPSNLINAMLDRDKALYAASTTPPPAPAPEPAPAPAPPPVVDTPPPVDAPPPDAPVDVAPPPEVTVNYFYDTLTPYGSWVDVAGYGRCWRPTVVIYDQNWSPYCDRGHWVYTDCGWYWDSDYSWGSTFHYGRWFHHARFGWCWYPDTVWAPSWVAWRSGGDYCGWAPLPPFAEFRPGFGFFYHGAHVGVDFDFGLAANCFVFVSPEHFCDRRPRSFCVPHDRVDVVFHQTTIINHFDVHDKTIVNHGFGPDRIVAATHHQIEPIHVGSLPNASRQGWRGDRHDQDQGIHQVAGGHYPQQGNYQGHGFDNGNSRGGNNQGRQGSDWHNNSNTGVNNGRNQSEFQNTQNSQIGRHGQSVGYNHDQSSTQPHPYNNNYNPGGRSGTQNQWQQTQQPQIPSGQNGHSRTDNQLQHPSQPQTAPIQSGHFGAPQQTQQPPQQQRQFGTLTEPNHVVTQNQWQQPQPPQHQPLPQNGYGQSWQQQQQTRQYNNPQTSQFGPQNQWQQQQSRQFTPAQPNQWQQQNQWQQSRPEIPPANEGAHQHYAAPPEPVHQAPPEPQHNYTPPSSPQPSQGQSQYHGGGSSGGGNNGNNGSNKQNH